MKEKKKETIRHRTLRVMILVCPEPDVYISLPLVSGYISQFQWQQRQHAGM